MAFLKQLGTVNQWPANNSALVSSLYSTLPQLTHTFLGYFLKLTSHHNFNITKHTCIINTSDII